MTGEKPTCAKNAQVQTAPQTTPTRDEAVPTGWKLVPVEPTKEMIHVARFGVWDAKRIGIGEPVVEGVTPFPSFGEEKAREVYRNMLATAPAPASGGVDAVAVKALEKIADEAKKANDVIRLNRDGGGQGRVKVATAMHRIAQWAADALSPAATPVSEAELERLRAAERELHATVRKFNCDNAEQFWKNINRLRAEALAKPASSPAGVQPGDLQLLDHLKRDNVLGGARPVVSGGEELAQAWRLSEDGLIALEQVARGVRLHITRKGIAALSQSTSAGRVGE